MRNSVYFYELGWNRKHQSRRQAWGLGLFYIEDAAYSFAGGGVSGHSAATAVRQAETFTDS